MRFAILLSLLLSVTICIAEDSQYLKSINQFVSKSKGTLESPKKSHPLYPAVVVTKDVVGHNGDSLKTRISLLNKLLTENYFKGIITKESDSTGMLIPMSPWRDILYWDLGGLYYQESFYKKTQEFFQGIPYESPLYILSRIELTWVQLYEGDVEKALVSLQEANKVASAFGGRFQNELTLLDAILKFQKKEYKEALQLLAPLKFESGLLYAMLRQVRAQCHFNLYLQEAKTLSLEDKLKKLHHVLAIIESISKQYWEPDFRYMISETYWHIASAYRIEDPVKFYEDYHQYLSKAYDVLRPVSEKSLNEKVRLLSEDGLFFSVILLWEQGKSTEAIARFEKFEEIYPQGKYLSDIYQIIGDYYFDKANHKDSLRYYQKLAATGDNDKSAYAIYKASWCFYNLGQKWKALRHMQRLVLFNEKESALDVNLKRESLNDLLLMIAELLSFKDSINEIKLYKYDKDKELEIFEKLSLTYKSIGRFDQASEGFKFLLDHNKENEKYPLWLAELMDVHLAAGKRLLISKDFTKYFNLVERTKLEGNKNYNALEDKFENILLTIHREARKSDDPDIWKATDRMYDTFFAHFPNSNRGKLWFFGAQRKEKTNKVGEALLWYQKAAMVKEFENHVESSLTVLRIIKAHMDDYSVAKKVTKEQYLEVAKVASWYIENFPNSNETTVAKYVKVEALHKAKNFDDLSSFVISLLSTDLKKEHWDYFLGVVNYYYQDNLWDHALKLSKIVYDKVDLASERKEKVKRFLQETTFQIAHDYETKKEIYKAREWYQKVIELGFFDEITIKAWNNIFISYNQELLSESFQKVIDAFVEVAARFEKSEQFKTILKDIFSLISKKYLDQKNLVMGTFYLEKVNKLADEVSLQTEIMFNYGRLGQAKKFYHYYEGIKMGAGLKKDLIYPVARLLFFNGHYREAFDVAVASYSKEKDTKFLILLRDIYFVWKVKGEDKLLKDFDSALMDLNIKHNPVFYELQFEEAYKSFDEQKKTFFEKLEERDLPDKDLKLEERLAKTKILLGELPTTKKEYLKIESKIPETIYDKYCALPKIGEVYVKHLNRLLYEDPKGNNDKEFNKRLGEKIAEVKAVTEAERGQCPKLKEKYTVLLNTRKDSDACLVDRCFENNDEVDEEDVHKILGQQGISNYDKVIKLYDIKAWAFAEEFIYKEQDAQKRNLLLSYQRLVHGDHLNAFLLLQKCDQADPRVKKLNSLILKNY